MNEKLKSFLLIPPGLALLGALIAAPQIVHLMDRGSTQATVAQIAAGTLSSRNVTVTALAFSERGMSEVVTKKNSQASPKVSFFMPIADPGTDPEGTLVVVQAYYDEVTDAAERPDVPLQLEGTVRDVLWEGLDGDMKESLSAIHPLSSNVKLLDLARSGKFDDTLWGYGAPLLGLILGLFIANGMKPKARPSEAPS